MAYSSDRRGPTARKDQKFNVPSNSRGRVYHSTPTKTASRMRPGGFQGNTVTAAAVFDTSLSSIQTDRTLQPSSSEDLKPPDKLSSQLAMLSQALNGSRKSEEDIGLIYKQQHELQLLMAELRDRDKELNETVAAHRKQLDAWDADRRKMLMLEERYVKCRKDLRSKDGYISHLESRMKSLEEREHSHCEELETTQVELQQAHIQTDHASKEFQKLKSHQQALQKSIRILKEREESLNRDLLSRNSEIAEKLDTSFKLEKMCAELEGKLKVSEKAEELLKQEVAAQRALIADSRQEQEKLTSQNELYLQDLISLKEELSRIRERCAILERELQLAGERDQRKEQLLSLQRTKQQRCDTELANIRQLYDRQQRELELLRLNLSSTQEQMVKQEEELSLQRHSSPMSTPEKSPDHHIKSPLVRNSYSRVSAGLPSKHELGGSGLSHVSTADVQHELGQLATGIRDKLASIFQSDSPPLQVDVDDGTNDADDASSVVSFPELPAVSGTTDLDSSSRLQKLLTESENLAREMNASQRPQANGSST